MTDLTRRIFLVGSVGILLPQVSVSHPAFAIESTRYRLEPKASKASLVENPALLTDVWAYNGLVPGPIIRARKGEEIVIEVINGLDQPTTIHWHGIRIENAMDGVAGMTQPAIQPGESFTYKFTPPDAGTYWYHPHNRSWEQLARGLYGMLIVEGDAEETEFDKDYPVIADDWRLDKSGLIDEASFGSLRDWSHAGRLGNELTLNGKAYEALEVDAGDRVRLRFVNTANARIMRFAIEGHEALLIGLDGQPIEPTKLEETGISLAPAQRADLLLDIKGKSGDRFAILETSGNENLITGFLVCSNKSNQQQIHAPFTALRTNALQKPDLKIAARHDLVMTGGAMRFLTSGIYKGEELDGRTLAQTHQQLWAFNGVAGMAEQPFFSAKIGETIIIKLVNETLWPHAIHLHGHHFEILSRTQLGDNTSSAMLAYEKNASRDTVLVERNETVEIAFVADNPGKWMLHCHMLEHQASGMGTWFEVA